MTGEQAAALGLASGRCIVCCRTLGGASLTAKVAATIGYGEICAGHNGWSFPKGAVAQRAYLADQKVKQIALRAAQTAAVRRQIEAGEIQARNSSRFD